MISMHSGRGAALLRIAAAMLAAILASVFLASCGAGEKPSVAVKREQLFSLSYGPAEDQLDLFQIESAQSAQKTCIAMREGFFYIANGAGYKIVRFDSFGDPLSMIYNTEKNPTPVVLKAVQESSGAGAAKGAAGSAAGAAARSEAPSEGEGLGRTAVPYPFRSVGEIAVDSAQTIYVEDRLPPERRVQDKDSASLLDHVVLRFDKEGQFIDYLGQEGIGGTPFPFILGLYTVASDDCVVVSMLQSGWFVHWFDKNGILVSALRLKREDLPMPDKGKDLIASLDRIVPDLSGRDLLIKVDYYKEALDPATKAPSGVEFSSSWMYRMDLKDGKYPERWQIHAIEKSAKDAEGRNIKYARVPSFIGATGRDFFLLYADDEGKSYISAYDRTTRDSSRYGIDIAQDELYYNAYYLSPSGVLCALLGTKYEARVVWWRFDKLLGAAGSGIVK